MRVHGDKKIIRRTDIEKRPYTKYQTELREDFHKMCGYCGKSEAVSKNTFEPDHFIPKVLAPDRKDDYGNLVYSCFLCNRKKGKKWPSQDPKIPFVNGEGFADPATPAYDDHLERNERGEIIAKTDIGRYMAEKVFGFHKRPMKEIWKAMQLMEKKELLKKKWSTLPPDRKDDYILIDDLIKDLQDFLFVKKE